MYLHVMYLLTRFLRRRIPLQILVNCDESSQKIQNGKGGAVLCSRSLGTPGHAPLAAASNGVLHPYSTSHLFNTGIWKRLLLWLRSVSNTLWVTSEVSRPQGDAHPYHFLSYLQAIIWLYQFLSDNVILIVWCLVLWLALLRFVYCIVLCLVALTATPYHCIYTHALAHTY